MVWARVADQAHNLQVANVTFGIPVSYFSIPVSFGSPGPSYPGWYWVWVGDNTNLKCCINNNDCKTLNTTSDLIKGRDGSERLDYIIPRSWIIVDGAAW